MRGRRGREQRVVDARERDDRRGERPGAGRPHERLEARGGAEALDAHGADLDDRVGRGGEPRGLDVDDREARAIERRRGHRALLHGPQLARRELFRQRVGPRSEQTRDEAPRDRRGGQAVEREQAARELDQRHRRSLGAQRAEPPPHTIGNREPVRAARFAVVHRAVPISPTLARASPAEVGSGHRTLRVQLGGGFADRITRGARRACRSAVEGGVRRSMILAAAVAGLLATAADDRAAARDRAPASRAERSCGRATRAASCSSSSPGSHRAWWRSAPRTRFAPEALAQAQRVELALPGSRAPVAVVDRFAVAPGPPVRRRDATMREDFAVFLLASVPRGVRALAADARGALSSGARVRLLGPGAGERDEQDAIAGTITAATAEQIEIELDAAHRARRAGAARPCSPPTAAAWSGSSRRRVPGEGKTRVLAAPIGGVLDALREPLDGGQGPPLRRVRRRTARAGREGALAGCGCARARA